MTGSMARTETAPRCRILFVGTLPPRQGGASLLRGALLAALASRDNPIAALSPMASSALAEPDEFALRNPAIDLVRYPVTRFEGDPFKPDVDLLQQRREQVEAMLPGLIDRCRPQVILSGDETNWGVGAVAQRYGLPHVLVLSGTVWAVTAGTHSPRATRALLQEFEAVTQFIAVADHLVPLMASLGLANVEVIANGVDLARFGSAADPAALRSALDLPEDAIVVLHPSNMKPVKRVLDIARSAPLAIGQDKRLVYVFVGAGPCLEALQSECATYGLCDHFRFTGWIDPSQMPDYYGLADIVIMPSESEGMASVYLETLASARTLLASNIPAARDLIDDGETGMLFALGDIADLAEKTLAAANDAPSRARLGANGRRLVAKHHDFQRMVSRYEDVLNALAG